MAQNIRGAANGERYAVVVSVVVVVRLPVYFAFGGPLDFGGAKSTQPSAKCSATVSAKKKNKKTNTRMEIELEYTAICIPFN